MYYKSNKTLSFQKDPTKSYVYISDGDKDVGMLLWNYDKGRWEFKPTK